MEDLSLTLSTTTTEDEEDELFPLVPPKPSEE
jgi:hypothetical protein